MVFRVFCDGGARGNPGPAAIGIVVVDDGGKIVYQYGKVIGSTTNNVAEYTAVIEALHLIGNQQELVPHKKNLALHFYLDSQLVVSQLNGIFKVKDPKLRLLAFEVRQLESATGAAVIYRHIPREQNTQADALVNRALDEAAA